MRTPPPLTFTPAASAVHRAFALLIATILVALMLNLARASNEISLKFALLAAAVLCVLAWLIRDAWRKPRGSLHYEQGQWYWVCAGQALPGTLHVHLDLQAYLLVSLTPRQPSNPIFPTSPKWFHLEARHARLGGSILSAASPEGASAIQARPGSWLALRCAVYAPVVAGHESVAA